MKEFKPTSDTVIVDFSDFGKFTIQYPTVGEMLEIHNKKMLLSGGRFDNMALSRNNTLASDFHFDLVIAFSTFSVLIPKFYKHFNVDSLLDIPAVKAKLIVDVYKKQFTPWYNELQKFLYDLDNLQEDTEEKDS